MSPKPSRQSKALIDRVDRVLDVAAAHIVAREPAKAVTVLQQFLSELHGKGVQSDEAYEMVYAALANYLIVDDDYNQALQIMARAADAHPQSNRIKLDLVRIALLGEEWGVDKIVEMLLKLDPPLDSRLGAMFHHSLKILEDRTSSEALDQLKQKVLLGY